MIISTGAGKASVKIQQFFVTKTLNKLGKENFLYLTKGFGNGTPLQCSCLENPMDGGAWWAAVHGVAKSRMRLSAFTFTFHFHTLEKEMAAHCSALAWRSPGRGSLVAAVSGVTQSRTRLERRSGSTASTTLYGERRKTSP